MHEDLDAPGSRKSTESVAYPLTKMGLALGLPFFAMTEWGHKWLGDGRSPFQLRSRASGRRLKIALVDERGRFVKTSDIESVIDPEFDRGTDGDGLV